MPMRRSNTTRSNVSGRELPGKAKTVADLKAEKKAAAEAERKRKEEEEARRKAEEEAAAEAERLRLEEEARLAAEEEERKKAEEEAKAKELKRKKAKAAKKKRLPYVLRDDLDDDRPTSPFPQSFEIPLHLYVWLRERVAFSQIIAIPKLDPASVRLDAPSPSPGRVRPGGPRGGASPPPSVAKLGIECTDIGAQNLIGGFPIQKLVQMYAPRHMAEHSTDAFAETKRHIQDMRDRQKKDPLALQNIPPYHLASEKGGVPGRISPRGNFTANTSLKSRVKHWSAIVAMISEMPSVQHYIKRNHQQHCANYEESLVLSTSLGGSIGTTPKNGAKVPAALSSHALLTNEDEPPEALPPFILDEELPGMVVRSREKSLDRLQDTDSIANTLSELGLMETAQYNYTANELQQCGLTKYEAQALATTIRGTGSKRNSLNTTTPSLAKTHHGGAGATTATPPPPAPLMGLGSPPMTFPGPAPTAAAGSNGGSSGNPPHQPMMLPPLQSPGKLNPLKNETPRKVVDHPPEKEDEGKTGVTVQNRLEQLPMWARCIVLNKDTNVLLHFLDRFHQCIKREEKSPLKALQMLNKERGESFYFPTQKKGGQHQRSRSPPMDTVDKDGKVLSTSERLFRAGTISSSTPSPEKGLSPQKKKKNGNDITKTVPALFKHSAWQKLVDEEYARQQAKLQEEEDERLRREEEERQRQEADEAQQQQQLRSSSTSRNSPIMMMPPLNSSNPYEGIPMTHSFGSMLSPTNGAAPSPNGMQIPPVMQMPPPSGKPLAAPMLPNAMPAPAPATTEAPMTYMQLLASVGAEERNKMATARGTNGGAQTDKAAEEREKVAAALKIQSAHRQRQARQAVAARKADLAEERAKSSIAAAEQERAMEEQQQQKKQEEVPPPEPHSPTRNTTPNATKPTFNDEQKSKEDAAATRIQAIQRRRLAQREVLARKAELEKQNQAATKIQAIERRRIAMKEVEAKKKAKAEGEQSKTDVAEEKTQSSTPPAEPTFVTATPDDTTM